MFSRKMKKKIIIGIHGLGNKPPRRLLKVWWKKSICDGLLSIGYPQNLFNFEIAYWSDMYYPRPLKIRVKDKESPFYIEFPYVASTQNNKKNAPSEFKKKSLAVIEKILDKIFFTENSIVNIDSIGDFIIRKLFQELDIYYHQDSLVDRKSGIGVRDAIRRQVAKILRKHKKKDILLIAHSMGSIIAYDVLTQVVPAVQIHTFITMGSPLGLPVIMKKILSEQNRNIKEEKKVPSPENIHHAWVNISDLDDKIALNYDLHDDYKENSHNVGPVDYIVNNDYEYLEEKNPHKSYGYLRTPEVAEVIHKFLSEKKPTLFDIIKKWIVPWIRSGYYKPVVKD